VVAARYTFRRLFLAGLTALLADAVGFAVLLVIDIPVIRELAIAASHRRGGADLHQPDPAAHPAVLHRRQRARRRSAACAPRGRRGRAEQAPAVGLLDRFTRRRWAGGHRRGAAAGRGRLCGEPHLAIGDLDPGAPELRADSRYNRDVAFMNAPTAPPATCWR
jgi:hypothetical protein